MTPGRGGRRRSAIWEHFEKRTDGGRSAACAYCAHVMKSQPDRMVAHFLRVCPHADADKRRRWLAEREATAAAAAAASAVAVTERHEQLQQQQQQQVVAEPASQARVVGDESVVATARARAPAVTKQLRRGQIQEQVLQEAALGSCGDGRDARERANGESDGSSVLDAHMVELKRRKLELETRKVELQIESLNYDNEVKRIKVVEENMLARKRLRDAGVPPSEIDLLLPLQRPPVL